MRCAEKEDLQRNCTAAWDAYATMVGQTGLRVESGGVKPPSISELVAGRAAGALSLPEAFVDAIRLRGDHLRASRELNAHLTRHWS